MQEEVTNKTIALIVDRAKLTKQTFEKAVKKLLEEMQKSSQPKVYRGKQTLKQLAGQNDFVHFPITKQKYSFSVRPIGCTPAFLYSDPCPNSFCNF